jgi:hypothetical protein
MAKYYVGETVEKVAYFRDSTGTLVDPDASNPVVTVTAPSGASTAYTYGTNSEVAKLATGTYVCRVTATASGKWRFSFSFTKGGISDIEKSDASVWDS